MTPSIRRDGEAVSPRTCPSMTPPSLKQLVTMAPDDGWMLFSDDGHTMIVYVVIRATDGFVRIYMSDAAEDVDMDAYRGEWAQCLQDVEPPTEWEEQMEEARGDRDAMCSLLQRINARTDAAVAAGAARHG